MGAFLEAGLSVEVLEPTDEPPGSVNASRARDLVARAVHNDVLWIVSGDGDPGLTDAIASEVSSRADAPDVEVLLGSWDVPGARLLDVVAAMDRLRSPGGCPWDADQTHASLAPYLVEETYETLDAIESGDLVHLAEELGDVLLQVVFHSRVAAEDPNGFDIDDVAGHLVDKLVRRHPHVFAEADAPKGIDAQDGVDAPDDTDSPDSIDTPDSIHTPEQVEQAWERIKAAERVASGIGQAAAEDLHHGISPLLPIELAAEKVASRVRRRDLVVDDAAQAELSQALADVAAAREHAAAALRRVALSARPSQTSSPNTTRDGASAQRTQGPTDD